MIALAAQHHSIPVVICTGLHSMTPELILKNHTDKYLHCSSPAGVFGLESGGKLFILGEVANKMQIPTPVYDFLESDLISLIITNIGPHPTSEVERLVQESFKNCLA
jgi:translation initiation factor eIF-2B subunit beta